MKHDSAASSRLGQIVEATAVFLILYQALRVLFSVLFGLIYDALFAERVPMLTVGLWLVAVLAALLSPVAAPRQPRARTLVQLLAAIVVFLARIALTLDNPPVRLVAAIVILAAAGFYLPTALRRGPRDVVLSLILALAVDQVLRAAGDTWDITLRPAWWPFQAALTVALAIVAGWRFRQRGREREDCALGVGVVEGLAWGAWLFLETSLLSFPNAIARWSGSAYHWTAPLLAAVTLLPLVEGGHWTARWGRLGQLANAAILLAGLALGSLVTGALGLVGLLLAQLAALNLLSLYFLPGRSRPERRPEPSLALGGVLFLVLSFTYAFTFTYAYTLDLFRGMGAPLMLLAGLLAAFPGLRRGHLAEQSAPVVRWQWATALAASFLVLTAVLAWPRAPRRGEAGEALRVATYNIHYGYDSVWHLSLEAQAKAIDEARVDVIALQEVDAGRPTSYMVDNAYWMARRLGMQEVYLPCVERLTGIALLSRPTIRESEGILLPSELEQTGMIWAGLDVGESQVNAFATWLGLTPEERANQLETALPFLAAHPGPATYGGDFNSTADSPVYARIKGAGFFDAFAALGLDAPPTDPAIEPTHRIDYIWLRDLQPTAALVSSSVASDHRMVVVEVVR